jgi:hypothetical protein
MFVCARLRVLVGWCLWMPAPPTLDRIQISSPTHPIPAPRNVSILPTGPLPGFPLVDGFFPVDTARFYASYGGAHDAPLPYFTSHPLYNPSSSR